MSKRPFTEEEDKEILLIAKTSKLHVGGEVLWKRESINNKVFIHSLGIDLLFPMTLNTTLKLYRFWTKEHIILYSTAAKHFSNPNTKN